MREGEGEGEREKEEGEGGDEGRERRTREARRRRTYLREGEGERGRRGTPGTIVRRGRRTREGEGERGKGKAPRGKGRPYEGRGRRTREGEGERGKGKQLSTSGAVGADHLEAASAVATLSRDEMQLFGTDCWESHHSSGAWLRALAHATWRGTGRTRDMAMGEGATGYH